MATAANRPGHKSAPQHVVAIGTAFWQGEAVAAVVADSRAVAEDAAELVLVDYEPLTAVVDMDAALEPTSPVIHPDLGDNLAIAHVIEAGQGTHDEAREREKHAGDEAGAESGAEDREIEEAVHRLKA